MLDFFWEYEIGSQNIKLNSAKMKFKKYFYCIIIYISISLLTDILEISFFDSQHNMLHVVWIKLIQELIRIFKLRLNFRVGHFLTSELKLGVLVAYYVDHNKCYKFLAATVNCLHSLVGNN